MDAVLGSRCGALDGTLTLLINIQRDTSNATHTSRRDE